jgi:hypothetical protein
VRFPGLALFFFLLTMPTNYWLCAGMGGGGALAKNWVRSRGHKDADKMTIPDIVLYSMVAFSFNQE